MHHVHELVTRSEIDTPLSISLNTANGLVMKGVSALLADDSFRIASAPARSAHETADCVYKWIQEHQDQTTTFEKQLTESLNSCIKVRKSSQKLNRGKMWSSYHSVRTSDSYISAWRAFLQKSGNSTFSPIFCQYVGDQVFKELIKLHCPLESSEATATAHSALTYEEINAIRYAAGYVPRALKKKLTKSAHPLKEDLQLCLLDLLDDGDEESNESQDWIASINRGGLTRINHNTFELFLAMEHELRKHLSMSQAPNLSDHVHASIVENEDVQFLWSIIGADWDENCGSVLLQMLVSQWVKIRGFSFASAWIEKYKTTQKKTIQKSKGVRKQLLPKPTTKNDSSTQEDIDHE